jgi:hypothetical protein
MEDYPRTLAELEARFSMEEACLDYLFMLRWSTEGLTTRYKLLQAQEGTCAR